MNTVSHIEIDIDSSGLTDTFNVFKNCILSNIEDFDGRVYNSGLYGTFTFPDSGETIFVDCHGASHTSVPVVFDLSASTNVVNELRGYTGTIQYENSTSSANTLTADLKTGILILPATVTEGSVAVKGTGTAIDGTGDNVNYDVTGLVNSINLHDLAKVHGLELGLPVLVSKTGRTVSTMTQTFEQIGETVRMTRTT